MSHSAPRGVYAQAKHEYDIAENEAASGSAELDILLLPDVPGKVTAAGRYTAGRTENRDLWSKLREVQLKRGNILGGWDWLLSDTFAQAEGEMQEGFFGENDLVERRDLDKRRRELDELAELDELFVHGASGLARSWLDEWPFVLLVLALWPLVWATWAGLTRGGVVPRLMGIALVNRHGRPAPRWRCFVRELFVWLPVVLLLVGSLFLDLFRLGDGNGWDQDYLAFAGWAAFGLWWLALLLLPVWAFRAVRGPRRSLPDRLAGLHLVPG